MANWLGGLSGAGGGAMAGSAFGPIGAGVGAGLGFLGGIFGGGKERKIKRMPLLPEEEQAYSALRNQGLGILQNPYQGFDPIAQRAQSVFNQQTIPGLAERFTGFTGGALSSPSFGLQGQQAGLDLAERLAALQAQYGLQNRQGAMNLLQLGLSPSMQQYERPAEGGLGLSLLQGGFQALPLYGQYQQSNQLQDILNQLQMLQRRGGQQ